MSEVLDGEIVDEHEERHLPAVQQERAVMVRDEMTVEDLLEQRAKILAVVNQAMRVDEHYGAIPGASTRKVLLKPGAEMLNVLFRLAPSYLHETIWGPGDHMTVIADCTLTHAPTGMVIATGSGMCTTREAKYAYRQGQRTCPDCGKATVRVGKARGDKPGNWYCWNKPGVSDGCGASWPLDGDQARAFEATDTGRVDNPDLPDAYNTVLKMADKRALVAATLNGTAASDFFTQDMEEHEERQVEETRAPDPAAKVPRGWEDIDEALSHYPEGVLADYRAFGVAVSEGAKAGTLTLPGTQFQANQMVVVAIMDRFEPSGFPGPQRSDWQEEWAKVLGGVILEPGSTAAVEVKPSDAALTAEQVAAVDAAGVDDTIEFGKP